MTQRKPTRNQLAVIAYFNGDLTARTSRVAAAATYAVCVREGWIEPIDEFPFHRTTDAGREALTNG